MFVSLDLSIQAFQGWETVELALARGFQGLFVDLSEVGQW